MPHQPGISYLIPVSWLTGKPTLVRTSWRQHALTGSIRLAEERTLRPLARLVASTCAEADLLDSLRTGNQGLQLLIIHAQGIFSDELTAMAYNIRDGRIEVAEREPGTTEFTLDVVDQLAEQFGSARARIAVVENQDIDRAIRMLFAGLRLLHYRCGRDEETAYLTVLNPNIREPHRPPRPPRGPGGGGGEAVPIRQAAA